jgi:hypothetical protein
MLYSFQIVILHKGALLKILVSHEYLLSVIALYVELLFIRCLCIDTACRSFPSTAHRLGEGSGEGLVMTCGITLAVVYLVPSSHPSPNSLPFPIMIYDRAVKCYHHHNT